MNQGQVLIAICALLVLMISVERCQRAQAADTPITRSDVDRIVRALENQTRAIQEAGRSCRK